MAVSGEAIASSRLGKWEVPRSIHSLYSDLTLLTLCLSNNTLDFLKQSLSQVCLPQDHIVLI